MKTGKRAWLYLIRKCSRSILLLLIVFALVSFIFIGAAIKTSVDAEAKQVQQNLASGFTVWLDNKTRTDLFEVDPADNIPKFIGPRLDKKVADKIMQVDGIRDYIGEQKAIMNSGVELVPGLYTDTQYNYEKIGYDIENKARDAIDVKNAAEAKKVTDFYMVTDSSLHNFFQSGAFTLVEGRHIKPDDKQVVMVSGVVAQKNGLNLGDIIEPEDRLGIFELGGDAYAKIGDSYPLTIIGIFHVNFAQEYEAWSTIESYIAENFMFSDYDTRNKWIENYWTHYQKKPFSDDRLDNFDTITFFVDDPARLDEIIEQVLAQDATDWSMYEIRKDDASYRSVVKPLNAISNVVSFLMVLLIGGGFAVLLLLLRLWGKSRIHEAGVLLALGIGTWNIVVQRIIECLLIGALAIIPAYFVANAFITPIGEAVNASTVVEEGGEDYTLDYQLGTAVVTIDRTVQAPVTAKYTLDLDMLVMGLMIGEGVLAGVVLLSCIGIFIMKPRKLMGMMG